MTTTIVRYDDATLAEIQRRFRAGRPPESGKRKRHSRCDVIVSLHPEIEELLNDGYTFDAIAEHFAAVDVVIEVATLKNYVGLARRKPGGTAKRPSPTARRSAGVEPEGPRTKAKHANAQRTQRKPSAGLHAAPTVEASTREVARDGAPSMVATAEPTAPTAERSAPSTAQDVPRTAATAREISTDSATAPEGTAEPTATKDEATSGERGAENSPVPECSSEVPRECTAPTAERGAVRAAEEVPRTVAAASPEIAADGATRRVGTAEPGAPNDEVTRAEKAVTAAVPMWKIEANTPSSGGNEESRRRAFARGTASTGRNGAFEMTPTSSEASTETSSSFPVPRRKRLEDL